MPRWATRDYFVRLNNSPTAVGQFNDLPIKVVNGATVYVRDVAHVRDGSAVQISMVRVNGKPAVLLTILKNGGASTLDVVNGVKAKLPMIRSLLPPDVKLDLLLDQSVFVRGAVTGRRAGSDDRGLSDGTDDPAVSGELAQHARRRHLHSALHPRLHRGCWGRWARRSTP